MLTSQTIYKLRAILGPDHVLTSPEDLVSYSFDATPGQVMPAAVVRPGSTEDVAAIVRLANEDGFPIVPRGAGTNLSGGARPLPGSVVLATSRLDRILEIDEGNLTARAQPGVVLSDFRQAVEARRLFYPPDPSSVRVATLGGTVAEGAGGLSGAKYGTTKDYILGLEVVLPTGDVIRTGGKTVKDRSGFDLTHLMVGSEGTLGVITEMTLRLIPLPEARQTCIAAFDSVEQAAETVMAIVRRGIVPMALELMDKESVHHAEAFRPAGLPLDAGAILLIEVDGSEVDVPHQLQRVLDACKEEGAREVRVAANDRDRELMWSARRAHYPALAQAAKTIIVEDVTVPRPVLAQAIRAIREAADRHHVRIGLAAHAGDGNIHPDIMCDESDPEEMARVHRFFQDIMRAAIDLGGSISGEHGIGLMKKEFLPWQRGAAGVEAMRRIKHALDPNNILNPDKVF